MEDSHAVSIVMYHYVRPLALTRYPGIKGRQLTDFDHQLDYLQANYQLLSMEEFLQAWSVDGLPDKAAVLTFDDGFIDHYTYVLPRLIERGITAAFFPAAAPLLDGRLLDVHRIHFILAAAPSTGDVADAMESLMSETLSLGEIANMRKEWGRPNAFDPSEIIYIKRTLQMGLHRDLRNDFNARLFERFVSTDERAFAEELYMNTAQLRLMRELGMHIGSHASSHEWLSRLSATEQAIEIEASLSMLKRIGVDVTKGWTMAYPYGDRNAVLCDILRAAGCSAAFTTENRNAVPALDSVYNLPRIDTVSIYP